MALNNSSPSSEHMRILVLLRWVFTCAGCPGMVASHQMLWGGNIPLALGTLLYYQNNTNLTQNTQPHTTINHNKMAQHRATSATTSTAAHGPPASTPAQFASSPHHGRRRACSVLYFFALWGLLGVPKRQPIMKWREGQGPGLRWPPFGQET
jgi:hypothetical protein